MNPNLVIDVGFYDGADTEYYLNRGFSVVAIEANPYLVRVGKERFVEALQSGQLEILNVGIAEERGTWPFYICREDEGSSSFNSGGLSSIREVVNIPCVEIQEIFERYGVPFYLKVDIEGNDRVCLSSLSSQDLPMYISWEAGKDALEIMDLLYTIGYRSFKIINQVCFQELAYIGSLRHRFLLRFRQLIGPGKSSCVRRRGYNFIPGKSSGPMAEETFGHWRSYADARNSWRKLIQSKIDEESFGWTRIYYGWYDIHTKR